MKEMNIFFSLFMLSLLFLSGCHSSPVQEEEDLFQFKDSYVGDNGAVGQITRRLPHPDREHVSGLELKTTEEPYGIVLNYTSVEKSEGVETNYKELALHNATYILALVQNAEWVEFHFVEQEFNVTREELQHLYGKDIRQFSNEEELSKFTQGYLEDSDRVNEFFE